MLHSRRTAFSRGGVFTRRFAITSHHIVVPPHAQTIITQQVQPTKTNPMNLYAIASAPSVSAAPSPAPETQKLATYAFVNFIEFGLQLGLLVAGLLFITKGGLEKLRMQRTKLNVIMPRKKDKAIASYDADSEDEEVLEDEEDDDDEESDNDEEEDSDEDDEEEIENDTTLEDVAGIDEAKREVAEIVDFMKNPEVYQALGAKLPSGILLSGPPGCGKTLLARAIAGEAGVPMVITSGSEFVEMYVGVGAQRVRQMFEEAKKLSPCIIFIDEIDSIGRKRSASTSSSNSEQDQTMNQLLTEMDGFIKNTGIVVIAATNRPDMLDDALLRPGRFDRHVVISPPSFQGRVEILRVHTRNKPLDADVSLDAVARMTKGFTGAELENLCNEAAIHAARKRISSIKIACFDDALDKILIGLDSGASMTVEQKRLVSYHEAGHVLMGILVNEYDLVKKVSIIPRGSTGGVTIFEPLEDNNIGLYTQQYLENQLIVALGGRVAEELIFGRMKTTTGAYSDLQRVRKIAWSMVTDYGFSQNMGQVSWSDNGLSTAKANEIDSEVQFLVDCAHTKATELMQKNESYLHIIAAALLEKGVMSDEDLRTAVAGISCTLNTKDGGRQ